MSARAGSTESVDRIGEDLDQGPAAQATGYHGKNSEVAWIQRLKQRTTLAENGEDYAMSSGVGQEEDLATLDWRSISNLKPLYDSSYHCDDLSVLLPGTQIDAYERPPLQITNNLYQKYIEAVHPSFPIISQKNYTEQYLAYTRRQATPNDKWLAILNLIFAISARYCHLIKDNWGGDGQTHLIFFNKARLLALKSEDILGHADLQCVQIYGLMAFYFMGSNQINRYDPYPIDHSLKG